MRLTIKHLTLSPMYSQKAQRLFTWDPNSTTATYTYPLNFSIKALFHKHSTMADEIEIGSAITSITYDFNSVGDIPLNSPIKVYMANTTINTFASTTSWIPENQFELVFDGGVDLTAAGN